MKHNEDAAPESLPTEAMTQVFARVFDVRDQAGTFGPALRAALTAVGRAPMQQDSGLNPGPAPGDLLAWGSQAVLDVAAERRRQGRAARGREIGVARAAGVAPAEVVPAASA